jgi:hypothetical protein
VQAMSRKQPAMQVSGYALAGRIQGCHGSRLDSREIEMMHGGGGLPPCRGGLYVLSQIASCACRCAT